MLKQEDSQHNSTTSAGGGGMKAAPPLMLLDMVKRQSAHATSASAPSTPTRRSRMANRTGIRQKAQKMLSMSLGP